MTNLFKKTFVAVAVASISSVAMADAVITVAPTSVSVEASASATNIPSKAITVQLGAEYAVGDIVTLTVSNNAADRLSWPNNLTIPAAIISQVNGPLATPAPPATRVVSAVVSKTVVLGRLSNTEGGATYRVTSLVDTAPANPNAAQPVVADQAAPTYTYTTNGATISAFIINLKRDVVAANNLVTLSYAAQTSTGVSLDTAGNGLTKTLTIAGETYYNATSASTTFGQNGARKIAIEYARTRFTTSGTSNNAKDSGVFAVGKEGVAYAGPRDLVGTAFDADTSDDKATFEVMGDFSWVKDIKKYQNSISVSGAGCELKDADVTVNKVKFTDNSVGGGVLSCTLALDLADGLALSAPAIIEPQGFTYNASVTYKDTGATYPTLGTGVERSKVIAENAAGGSWVLNAYSAEVNYMPYGDGISQILYFTNKGGTVGKIFADVWTTAGTKVLSNQEVGVTVANGKTMLSGTVRDALAAKGVTSDRVRIRLVAEVPASQGAVYSAYNVSGDRIVSY